jgi:hypothetical protein
MTRGAPAQPRQLLHSLLAFDAAGTKLADVLHCRKLSTAGPGTP